MEPHYQIRTQFNKQNYKNRLPPSLQSTLHSDSPLQTNQNHLHIQTQSFSQTLKLTQTVYHLEQKHQYLQKNQQQQVQIMQNDMRKAKLFVEKNMEETCKKVEALIGDANEFCLEICGRSSGVNGTRISESSQLNGIKSQNEIFQQWRDTSTNTTQAVRDLILPHQSEIITSLSTTGERISRLSQSQSKQQKHSHAELLKLVNFSNENMQSLQVEISEFNRLSEERAYGLEDELLGLAGELELAISCEHEQRTKEDTMISSLLQKVIYKMGYL